MSIPNPDHFLEQADRLAQTKKSGAPRQVDLRRAVSTAYYGILHAVMTAVADQVLGISRRPTREYERVYRLIDHKDIRELCLEIKKPRLTSSYVIHAPTSGFDVDMIAFATGFISLQASRYSADYSPLTRFNISDAATTIQTARATLSSFRTASAPSRTAFLSLLVFPPRR